jgi:hypothetical protein
VAANPTVQRWHAGWDLVARTAESVPDVAATAARVLARCRPDGTAAPASAAALAPVLRQAGLLKSGLLKTGAR